MGRIAVEDFEGREVARIFIAASLKEATLVEEILTREGIDYFVELENFVSGPLTSPRSGAAFYVISGQASFCRARFVEAGLRLGVVGEEPDAG